MHKSRVGFVWNDIILGYDYANRNRGHSIRFQKTIDELRASGFLQTPTVEIMKPEKLSLDLLKRIHSERYINFVKNISDTGEGDIDIDTPGFKGIFDLSLSTSGALVSATRAIHRKEIIHSFCLTGGFHHASYDRGGGFCVFNDIAAAVYDLQDKGYERILVADFDVHHGNGTQKYFYDDPSVMHISFHEDPEWMYPHDGYISDIGAGSGKGFNINMPFPMDAGDSVYRFAFDEIVPPLLDYFQPEFIIFMPGSDAHYLDPLAHIMLTTETIHYVTERIHEAAHEICEGRLAVPSGGGYNQLSYCRSICAVMSVLTGHPFQLPDETPPFEDDDEIWSIVESNVKQVKSLVYPELGIL